MLERRNEPADVRGRDAEPFAGLGEGARVRERDERLHALNQIHRDNETSGWPHGNAATVATATARRARASAIDRRKTDN
ncbi:hypothetical protein OH687_21110 [Burkholderia anthina]|nr:hypothetical protein OH687_21110 [Burkholderia anthina]